MPRFLTFLRRTAATIVPIVAPAVRRIGRSAGRGSALLCVVLALAGLGGWQVSAAWEADRLRQSAQRQGPQAQEAIRALLDLVATVSASDDENRLNLLNQFFNRRVQFRDDIEVWGQVDYWATPLEMLARGLGDCEDYAIAKYFALMAAGVSPARLRLVYVKATLAGVNGAVQQAHMVLAYYPGPGASDPLILDNLLGEIRPASRRPDLLPVFSFNAEGLWTGTQGPGAGDPLARLSRWRDLLTRAREQGFM